MITRRTMPWSIYAVLLVAIEILGFYASACFLYDDVSIQNFSEYMIRGCTENWFLPWRIANAMTPECMGIALMGWIFLVSYMMYHFRNWQGGMEHGAEDWADAFDVAKRRANPDDTKNRVLSANVRIDTQGDRKLSNNNMIVIGSSGTYKTTSVVTPNLLQANENYIILDVKGELLYKYGLFLKSRGYTIRVLNLKEQDKSDAYNPFDYIENELDLIKLIANIQAACNPPDAMTSDPFWKEGAGLYLQAVFYYEWFMARREGRPGTFNNVLTLLNEETRPDTNVKPVKGQPQQTVLQSRMNALEKEEGPDNPAVRDYRKLKEGAAETVRSIVIIINAMLKLCQTEGLKRIFSHDDLHLRDFATGVGGSVESPNLSGRLALFMVVNDEDDSYNFICSMVYTQALEILSRMADTDFKDRGGALPIPLTFWMDEFYAGARPQDTEKVMGVIRSRNISMVLILQSVAQIKTLFSGDKWQTIMDNCVSVCLAFASQTEARFNGRRVAAAHWKFATSAKRRGLKFSDLQASPRGGCGVTLLAAVPPLPRCRRGRDGHAQVHLRPPREHDDRHRVRHGPRPGGRRVPSEIRRTADDAAAGQADEAQILHHTNGRGTPDL